VSGLLRVALYPKTFLAPVVYRSLIFTPFFAPLYSPSTTIFTVLTGHIPNHIGKLTNLSVLRLQGNHLVGPIPDSIGDLMLLEDLDLSSNHLKGTTRVCDMCVLLSVVMGCCVSSDAFVRICEYLKK
jgi:hypothetical protein